MFPAAGRAIHYERHLCDRVHRCRQALHDAGIITNSLGQWRPATRGARRVRHHNVRTRVVLVVHALEVERHGIRRRSNDDIVRAPFDWSSIFSLAMKFGGPTQLGASRRG